MPLSSGDAHWFESEFGFAEPVGKFDQVRDSFDLTESADGAVNLTSKANGRSFFVGPFELPSVRELRERLAAGDRGAPAEETAPEASHVAQEGDPDTNPDERAASLFAQLDTLGQGVLSCEVLLVELLKLGVDDEVSPALLRSLDTNGNGKISLSEFSRVFNAYPELEQRALSNSPNGPDGINAAAQSHARGLVFENISGNARSLHMDSANAGGVFQAASQFNCLEMVGPGERPEDGITQYYKDKTQGPVCAMAAPSGTVYRNYFVPVGNRFGQAGGSSKQIDTTRDVAELVANSTHKYWTMKNGYLMPCSSGSLKPLNTRLSQELVDTGHGHQSLSDAVTAAMRLGVHWDTEVAKSKKLPDGSAHRVCQVYSSAVPVSYCKSTDSKDWAPIACAILDAQYEGTLAVAALLARARGVRVPVFLTSVGGGAFGNRSLWIVRALDRALTIHKDAPLDVKLVHYMRVPKGDFSGLEKKFGAQKSKQRK